MVTAGESDGWKSSISENNGETRRRGRTERRRRATASAWRGDLWKTVPLQSLCQPAALLRHQACCRAVERKYLFIRGVEKPELCLRSEKRRLWRANLPEGQRGSSMYWPERLLHYLRKCWEVWWHERKWHSSINRKCWRKKWGVKMLGMKRREALASMKKWRNVQYQAWNGNRKSARGRVFWWWENSVNRPVTM